MLTIASRLAPFLALAFLAACGDSRPEVLGEPLASPRSAAQAWTTLQVGPDTARIARDGFGTPHVFAPTNRALFVAYGWAVAEDRLFQLELNRRAARGRLAALFGPAFVPADRVARVVGYTDAELDAMFAALVPEEREIYEAYRDGVNRYLDEVVAANPAAKLPFEFHALGAFPEPWTDRDSVAFGAFMVRRFGEIGGREPRNLALLERLALRHGPEAGAAIFGDVRWLDDPDAPVTVPDPASGPRQKPAPARTGRGPFRASDDLEVAKALWESLGVPTRLGSYAWTVSAARSAEGGALLYGGPQMGSSSPEVLHEVQLTGGNGFHVVGMAFAGAPPVLIGRNAHVAWTSTTASGDNLDVYLETLCDAGAGPGTGYGFRGACLPFEARVETIDVRGGAPALQQVLRTVHGPVVDVQGGFAFSQRRAHWMRELETGSAFFAFGRAAGLSAFEAAVRKVVTSHNFLYVDRRGNIAYWQAGQVPVRPVDAATGLPFDPRLPLPGDGSAEWTGALVPVPRSVNPPQGWLANWNNKPSRHYPAADEQIFGKQGRLREIAARLAALPAMTLDDMRDIPRDIGRVKGNGRDARYLVPHLLAALDAAPPLHPAAAGARAVVEGWSGNAFADAVASTTLEAGEVIFETWLSRALANAFGDELGPDAGEASANMLLHALDAATGGSGVPPSRDHFAPERWQAVLSRSFDEAVAGLAAAGGPGAAAWTAPRPETVFRHPVLGEVARIPASNRATYAQIVLASRPRMSGESIFTLGQSGFVRLVPPLGFEPDPHFADQLPLYAAFEYKPQPLFRNVQLRE
jgi:penicillin amidase